MKKRTTEEFIELAKQIHRDKYDYAKTVYVNKRTKVTITCPIHGDFEQTAHSHINGRGCPECGITNSSLNRTLSSEEFVNRGNIVHNNKYNYSNVNYVNSNTKVCIICPKHGEFWQEPRLHLSGSGCPKCANETRVKTKQISRWSNKRVNNTQDFIEKAKLIHNDYYDYSKVHYINAKTKVIIICPKHGEFLQTPNNHLNGQGCYKCGRLSSKKKSSLSLNEFIEKAKSVHNNYYDYSKVNYINNRTKVCITCPIHGEFWQTPDSHLSGHCCQLCGAKKGIFNRTNTSDSFIKKSSLIHCNKYDYSKVKYVNNKTKVCIICPEHGEFWQTPDSHIGGHGCPICGNMMSTPENEIFNMLSDLHPIQRERTILDGREIDIYLPSHKLGIEYHGLRWHTDFFGGKGRKYHISKLNDCLDKGINLIQIFEDEYINHREIVLNKISHIIGLDDTKPKIYARNCVVCEITKEEAKEFLNQNHIQGFAGASLYLGLKYKNILIGAMLFLEESKGFWNLNRFATDITHNCIGAGGKLFKHFIRNYEFKEIKSFADRRWTINYNDNLYTKLGFKNVGFTPAEYTYYNPKVEKYKRFHKFSFRKQTLHKKYGLPLTMTETEMIKELGYDRIWDCGLIKYVYKQTD